MLHCFKAALQENKEIFQDINQENFPCGLKTISSSKCHSLKSISLQSIRKPIPRLFTTNNFINTLSLFVHLSIFSSMVPPQ